jgi:hypothetical protein
MISDDRNGMVRQQMKMKIRFLFFLLSDAKSSKLNEGIGLMILITVLLLVVVVVVVDDDDDDDNDGVLR